MTLKYIEEKMVESIKDKIRKSVKCVTYLRVWPQLKCNGEI